ncbi:chromosome segregation protein SMC [Uliginosibacterium sp. H3]|uniref:Chromosome partition protein Smc n=1 Tax=Uliginosibacterium silvisoli TaxID=3114758 RepID=A0ABU6K9F9_9RHOO|nr:chromosome segregation protein SMC [Uliginosibacterium sp. H3]
MRLSKLKLAGFKSFVDPTTVLTPGQLVGIVGPNGCGKSNLIDAVRWVLGESRASALRGDSMQDVIFNGSTTRKPVSRASVELIFDNADGKAAGQWSQYAEIAVKRVLDRSGDSDYLINNVRVRRKDVIDLFLGTGLGPRAYAIIEQGMISRVIEARPEEVRAFLEEAAGITKYKERRRETEGRLADARDNLARLEDLRAELGQQITRLSGQAEVAQTWRTLNDNLLDRQSLLWVLKLREGERELQLADTAVADSGRSLEAAQENLRQIEVRLSTAREQHTRMSEAVGLAQGDVYAIAAEVSRIENELRVLREQRTRLAQRIDQLGAAAAQWQGRATALAADRERWTAQAVVAEKGLADARLAHEGTQAQQPGAEQALAEARVALDGIRRELAMADQQARVEETRRSASERALLGLEERQKRILDEQGSLVAPPAEELDIAEAKAASLSEDIDAGEEMLAQRTNALQDLQTRLRAAQESEKQAGGQVTAIRARLDALKALQSRLRDQGDLADWLRTSGLAALDPAWQQISVETGWELALEAALRERLGARGPLSPDATREILSQSAPVTTVLLREANASAGTTQIEAPSGTRAFRELVSTRQSSLGPVLDAWLVNVFVVDELTSWVDHELPAGVTLVAKSGQLLSAGEIILFAPDARTHGALERQREMEQLTASLDAAELEHEQQQAVTAELDTAAHDAQTNLATSREQLARFRQAQHSAQLALVQLQQALARHEERSVQLTRERDEVERAKATELGQKQAAAEALDRHQLAANGLRVQLSSAEQALSHAEQGQTQTREMSARQLRSLQEAEFALRECQSKLDDIARNEALVREEISRGEVELAHLIAERDGLDESNLNTSLQTALQLRGAREAELLKRRQALEEITTALRTQDEERLRCEQGLEPLREAQAAGRMARQAAEIAITQANERLTELNVDARSIDSERLEGLKETSLTREVARLTREIAELGPVNLAALTELSTTTERKTYLDAQYDDLMQAIGTLEDAIRRIDRDTREAMQATYNTVNRHFGELFPQLFGGGEAELVLVGDDVLDAGVQIVARPPGKKNTSIHLLSGGEKALTAIALVFAMFQLNPAPFCMLDEVDAPLDDTNTERYCEMVKRMSSVTQFVFISHSKITMERAQQLVGVTMQEQGVSRVVEVDIDAALKMAEPLVTAPAAQDAETAASQ